MATIPDQITTPLDIVNSYVNLLSMQYQKPNAQQTVALTSSMAVLPQTSVQNITFSVVPASGTFVLSYNGVSSTTINWNDSAATIQSDLQTIPALSAVTVSGSIASQTLTVTFTGVIPTPAQLLVVVSNTLFPSCVIDVVETDVTLPLAIQTAYNITPSLGPVAVGSQLDTVGSWVGVTRSGQGFTTFITLDDADFLTFIQMAITKNSAGSSLSDIANFMFSFFGTNVLVYDSLIMELTYIISSTIGSLDLIELLITEGLLPKPMAVLANIYYIPVPLTNLFAWGTAQQPIPPVGHGFTTAQAYDATGHWLVAQDIIVTP